MFCPKCEGKKTIILEMKGSDANPMANVRVQGTCDRCQGTGEVGNPVACTQCNGSKMMSANFGGFNVQMNCNMCNGSGRIIEPSYA